MQERKLLLVLDYRNYEEINMHRDLVHDGGKMLKHLMDRLSIPRDGWEHTYVYPKIKDHIPTTKANRWQFLQEYLVQLRRKIDEVAPAELIAMGGLACEVFTGVSRVAAKQGTCWRFRKEWWNWTNLQRVWVSYAPDACLFTPEFQGDIVGVVAAACRGSGIEYKVKPLNQTIAFDWSEYI